MTGKEGCGHKKAANKRVSSAGSVTTEDALCMKHTRALLQTHKSTGVVWKKNERMRARKASGRYE